MNTSFKTALFFCLLMAGIIMPCNAQGRHLPGASKPLPVKQKGSAKTITETFYYDCKMKHGVIQPSKAGDPTIYHYDAAGRMVESEVYMFGMLFRHGKYAYDDHGEMTRNVLLSEDGDSLINCHYSYRYDTPGRPIYMTCHCAVEKEKITEYRYTDYGDSIAQDIIEDSAPLLRYIYNAHGQEIRAYSHYRSGRYTMLQISLYEPVTTLPDTEGLSQYEHAYLYAYNEYEDLVKEWRLQDGKWVEDRRYEYQYDSHNNWTQKHIISPTNGITLVRRDITY